MGLLAPGLIGCGDNTPVVDNATGNNTTGSGAAGGDAGGGNTTGGGNTAGGGNATGPGDGGNSTGGSGSSGGGTPPPSGPPIRYDIRSPQGQAMLAIYARAVGTMMALPQGDPRSWTFQWYSHWVGGGADQSAKNSELARIYGGGSSPQRTLAQLMWDGCQAHGDNEDENFFLPWHRMFVMAFEGIIRSVAGEPAFTLPYWNYLDPAQRAIPSQFRRPGDPVWGALYRSTRNGAVNAGGAIASAAALTPEILSEANYSPSGADQGFCANLDFGLHGTVHVGVGNATNGMGVVPWAANDPVFWLHHCNIDRLWASWNAAGGANPSDAAFTSKPFIFADANGAQTSRIVSSVLNLASAGYDYDALIGADGSPLTTRTASEAMVMAPPPPGTPPMVGAPAPQMALRSLKRAAPIRILTPSITHVLEQVQLGQGTLHVRLSATQAAPALAARALAPLMAPTPRLARKATPQGKGLFPFLAQKAPPIVGAAPPPPAPTSPVLAPKPGQKVFLVLSNLTTEIQPGVLYSVYLEAPRGRGAPEPFLVGSLNFFSAMGGMGGMKMANRSRSFDITDLANRLAGEGRMEASPAISFVPASRAAAAAQPLIGSVSLAIQ